MQKLHPQQLRELFKVELHRHLDCSVRWSTLVELAPLVGIELPENSRQKREKFLITQPMQDLESVLKKFLNAQKILASEEILERIAYEACEDAYNDGIRLLELRYAPTFITEGHTHLNFSKIHQAFVRGIQRAEKKWEMGVGLIAIIQRTKDLATAEKVIDFTIDHKDSFVGVDLADNESACDPKTFIAPFEKAKKAGLHITIHSGETPGSAKSVQDSIQYLHAERIGHGVQIINDPQTLAFVRDRKIPLEVCPISNWLTQAFPSHQHHPIRQLIDQNILITINSDDPGVFATTLTDDYQVLNDVHGFTLQDFARANHIAFQHCFIKDKERFNHLFKEPSHA